MPSPIKYFSEDEARTLASNIVNFWVSQGYAREVIDVKVEKTDTDAVIRSNLRNGTPPGKPERVEKPRRVGKKFG
jgi:hypothetical protein